MPHKLFAEYFSLSGLVINPNILWVNNLALYDFAYLLRLVLNTSLQETEIDFINELYFYFSNHFETKIIIYGKEQFKEALNNLQQCLDIYRIGEVY